VCVCESVCVCVSACVCVSVYGAIQKGMVCVCVWGREGSDDGQRYVHPAAPDALEAP